MRRSVALCTPIVLTIVVVVTTLVVAATAGGTFAWRATAATSPVEQTAAQAFCADVNHERAARGLAALRCTYNGSAQATVESHQDRTDVWIPLANNSASAIVAFMQSDAHRYSLLAANATAMDVGVSCASYQPGDGSTDFGMYVGADFDQHPTAAAPLNPIVTRPDDSTPCGARIPPPTAPPSPQPPGAPPSQVSPSATPPPPSGGGESHQSGNPAGSSPRATGPSPNSTTAPISTAGDKSLVTSTTVLRHGSRVANGSHWSGEASSSTRRRPASPSGSMSDGGPWRWWWALLPASGLAIAGALFTARRKRGHSR